MQALEETDGSPIAPCWSKRNSLLWAANARTGDPFGKAVFSAIRTFTAADAGS
jgi:hypothetical protein